MDCRKSGRLNIATINEKFNSEIEKIKAIKTFSKRKQILIDDLASGYLSAYADNECSLDQGLIRIKTMRKMLRAKGYSSDQVNDFIIERAYISKADIRKIFNESIYNFDDSIRTDVETIPAHFNGQCTTDLIIDELKARPELLKALDNKMDLSNMQKKFRITNVSLLQQFYNANKDIINM